MTTAFVPSGRALRSLLISGMLMPSRGVEKMSCEGKDWVGKGAREGGEGRRRGGEEERRAGGGEGDGGGRGGQGEEEAGENKGGEGG